MMEVVVVMIHHKQCLDQIIKLKRYQARSQKFFWGGGGDRLTKKLLFGLRQVINLYSPPGI
jgi:hypothetical protein